MAVFANVTSIITIAEISQYLSQRDITNNINRGDGDVNIGYPRLLYLVRQGVQWAYDQDPTDETLNATSLYLYALCGRYVNAAQTVTNNNGCTPPVILVQPVSQAIELFERIDLSVIAYSTAAISYQWYFNGVAMVGETNSVLELEPQTPDEVYGSYYVVVSTPCGTVRSDAAVITNDTPEELPIIYYGTKADPGDPNEATILLGDTSNQNPSEDVVLNWGAQSGTPVYYWFAIPVASMSEKTHWYESILNNGTMLGGGDLFSPPATASVGLENYYVYVTNYATQFTENDYTFSIP